jgi:hypothetical protein
MAAVFIVKHHALYKRARRSGIKDGSTLISTCDVVALPAFSLRTSLDRIVASTKRKRLILKMDFNKQRTAAEWTALSSRLISARDLARNESRRARAENASLRAQADTLLSYVPRRAAKLCWR